MTFRLEKLEDDKREKGKDFKPVPHVFLAARLIYYAYWLRWTEEVGLV